MDPKAGMAQKIGESKLPGKKALDLTKKPPKKGLGGEIKNLRGDIMKWHLEGDTGKFGKAKIEDVLCVTFVPTNILEGYNEDFDLNRRSNFYLKIVVVSIFSLQIFLTSCPKMWTSNFQRAKSSMSQAFDIKQVDRNAFDTNG